MKKICFFTNSMFIIGGEQRITTLVANSLIEEGYDVTIIIKNKEKIDYSIYNLSEKAKLIFLKNNYDFRLNNKKIFEKLRIINRKYGFFKYSKLIIRSFFCSKSILKQLKSILVKEDFDIVIGVAGDRSYILSYLKKHIKGKIFFWNHMNIDAHYKKKKTRYQNEETFIVPLMKRFNEIIVLTKDDQKKIKEYYNIDSKVIPNFCQYQKQQHTKTNKKFMAAGRLVEQKGFDILIKAFKNFSKENSDWILDIYGEGIEKEKLQKIIDENTLNNRIFLKEKVENIEEEYKNHDIYLMSSRYEGFGLVTLEALICGLPVISFNIPASEEIIEDKKTGLIIEKYDIEEYSRAMKEVINNLDYYRKNIASSNTKFNKENIIKQWLEIID